MTKIPADATPQTIHECPYFPGRLKLMYRACIANNKPQHRWSLRVVPPKQECMRCDIADAAVQRWGEPKPINTVTPCLACGKNTIGVHRTCHRCRTIARKADFTPDTDGVL